MKLVGVGPDRDNAGDRPGSGIPTNPHTNPHDQSQHEPPDEPPHKDSKMRIESINIDAMKQLTAATKKPDTNVGLPTHKFESRSVDTIELSGKGREGQRVVGGRGTPIFEDTEDQVTQTETGSIDDSIDIEPHQLGRENGRGHKYGHNRVALETTIEVGDAELNLKFKGALNGQASTNMVRKLQHQLDNFIERNDIDEETAAAAHDLVAALSEELSGALSAESGDRAALRDTFQSAFASFTEALANLFNTEPNDEPGDEVTGEVSLTERKIEGTVNTGSTAGASAAVGSLSGADDLLGSGGDGGSVVTGSTGQFGSGLLLDVTG